MHLKRILVSFFCVSGLIAVAQTSTDTVYVAKYKSDKQCAISYTFDDGLVEHYTLVFPRFEQLGFKGTFWINGNTINEGEKGLVKSPRTTWEQLKQMAAKGHEISNHGWSHKNLARCTLEEARVEIERNDSIITAIIGERPITFCYANNAKTKEVIKLASLNRVGTRLKQFAMGSRSTPDSLVRIFNRLIDTRDWGVSMIHGITHGYDAFKSDSVLWNNLTYVKEREGKIWVGTFRDVAAYTTEQQNIRLETSRKGNKVIVKPHLSLDKKLFKYPLTLVVPGKDLQKVSVRQNGKPLYAEIRADKALIEFNPNGGKVKIVVN